MARTRAIPLLLGAVLLFSACLGGDFDFDSAPSSSISRELSTTPVPWPADIKELRFGVPPIVDKAEMEEAYAPLAHYLEQKLEVPTRLVQAESYGDLAERMQRGEVELALFTAASYVETKRRSPGLRVILKQISNGSSFYLGYIYCKAELPINELEDLRGHSICFVDPLSTSGYLYPRMLLRRRHLDADDFFSQVVMGGNHLACIDKVLAGECDAGATWAGALTLARDAGKPVHKLRLLAKTRWIPFNALAVRGDLPPDVAHRITQELLMLNTRSPDGKRVLSHSMRMNAWARAEDADYDSVRMALRLGRSKKSKGSHP